MKIIDFLFLTIIFTLSFSQGINPYHVLQLEQGAPQDKVRLQYKLLKKSAKDNKIKQQLYEDAYREIMIDETLEMTLSKEEKKAGRRVRKDRRRRGLPRFGDMFRGQYFKGKGVKGVEQQRVIKDMNERSQDELVEEKYEYQLPFQYNNPSYHQDQKRAEQVIRDENIAFNRRAAGYILFFAGILLKLTPCICIFLIWKCRRQTQREGKDEIDPITKAVNGWTGRNRRQQNKKMK